MADINGTPGNDAIQPFGSSLLLTLSGSQAEGIWPLINVKVNGQTLASGVTIDANHATGATETVSVAIPAGVTPTSVQLEYVNDVQANYDTADRNLYVSSISLNGTVLPSSAGVFLRSSDNVTINGPTDLVWGGTLTFSGSVVTNAAVNTSGNVSVDGLGGIDTVLFGQAKASYSITNGSTTTVSGNGQTATMTNVERLQFSDISLALDMNGNAGTVAKLIATAYGATYVSNEGFVGIGLDYADSGLTAKQLAELAVSQPVFTQLAGSASNADFVKLVYQNVTGNQPSAQELANYTAMLDGGSATRADLVVMASETSFIAAQLTGVMQAGVEFV